MLDSITKGLGNLEVSVSNAFDKTSKLISSKSSSFASSSSTDTILGVANIGNQLMKTFNSLEIQKSLQDSMKQVVELQKNKDLRVSLRCAPITSYTEINQTIIDRLEYILGTKQQHYSGNIPTGSTSVVQQYGSAQGVNITSFLYDALSPTVGLIFPYTPTVTFNYSVNYDNTSLFQSNLAIQHYNNTPPPTISVDAKFTADTKENAKYMLAAIWFLKAVTKCDFGYQAKIDNKRIAGTPPPVLYLHGYGDYIMNYIPVVIKSFNFRLPDDVDYTSVMFNLSNAMKFVDYFSTNNAINEIPNNSNNQYIMKNLLPIQMSLSMQLTIQPNIYKNVHNFDLNAYKQGVIQYKASAVKNTSSPQYFTESLYSRAGWTW